MTIRIKRRVSRLLVLVSILTLVASSTSAYADDITDLESKTSNLQQELSGLNQELVALSDRINSTKMQIEIIDSEILRTQDSLAVAAANRDQQYNDMKNRIKFMYETGNTSFLEMLFTSESMAEFLNKAEFIRNVSSYDRAMLEELQNTQKQIEEERAVLKAQQDSLKNLHGTLTSQEGKLQQKASDTSTDLASFNMQLAQLRAEEARRQQELAEQLLQQQQNNNQSGANRPDGSGSGTINSGNQMQVPASELDVFAGILQCEAYQNYEYMLAVATVIMNRVNDPRFPNTISGVVYAPGQFEPTWTGRLDTVLKNGPCALAYQVAQDALNGARLASVAHCYYFLYAGATDRPGVNVGNNLFFPSW